MNALKSNPPQKLAISSQKGGVGKTTTSLSLSACLAEMGMNVLVIDLDPQAHLTQSLGVQPDKVRRTIGDALLLQSNLLAVTRETSVSNLDLIPANNGLLLIDKLLFSVKGYETRLKSNLDSLNGHYYDVIIFDCPPTFSTLTINALTAANLAIIPVTCDYFSAQSLMKYLELFELIQRRSNATIKYRILITMFDARTRISHMVQEQYRHKYNSSIFNTVISMDVKLRESPVFNQPITQYASKARGASEYRNLAKELMPCLYSQMTTN